MVIGCRIGHSGINGEGLLPQDVRLNRLHQRCLVSIGCLCLPGGLVWPDMIILVEAIGAENTARLHPDPSAGCGAGNATQANTLQCAKLSRSLVYSDREHHQLILLWKARESAV